MLCIGGLLGLGRGSLGGAIGGGGVLDCWVEGFRGSGLLFGVLWGVFGFFWRGWAFRELSFLRRGHTRALGISTIAHALLPLEDTS